MAEDRLHFSYHTREGHSGVVSALINCAKARPELESGMGARDMVRMMDGYKDTALHKAVRKGHFEVVKLLVKEDPEFEFGANEAGETLTMKRKRNDETRMEMEMRHPKERSVSSAGKMAKAHIVVVALIVTVSSSSRAIMNTGGL
ncbi:PREDICTED: uncharacterized protein LOC109187437 [Ipomoea nil]|uniref:uncharacterized protein LOC109187437 n=1 Tax=Ipomoea nil TaxID=35883 RepID=UPI000901971D|nr:PREDICTED: uncharacterized protein LOC109187437 [Ipomoea nil]